MKLWICRSLIALLLGQPFMAMAAEPAPAEEVKATATAFLTPATTPAVNPQPASGTAETAAPELPVAVEEKADKEEPALDPKAKADVETPQGEPETRTETVKVPSEKPKRFLWGNFLLGAAGGALLGGVVGFIGFTKDSKTGGIDYAKARLVVPAAAAGGALLGGVLSVLLGATTPPPATPPDISYLSPAFQPCGCLQTQGSHLIYSVQF